MSRKCLCCATQRFRCCFVSFFNVCVRVVFCSGKVAVKKEDLQKYHGKDTWFQLQPVSADSEVQVSSEGENTSRTHIYMHTQTHTHTPSSFFCVFN